MQKLIFRSWYRIRTDNYEEGWVSGRYIELR
ncbi:MAG: SH3 domain-containing protein [Synergistaceae bacterium]|nr:SH3 domain-containing protein [Synergistaceae bacterium]